jgi:hypothetical protein
MTTSELIIAALRNGASALKYRAERMNITGADERSLEQAGIMLHHAQVLTELADADEAQRAA